MNCNVHAKRLVNRCFCQWLELIKLYRNDSHEIKKFCKDSVSNNERYKEIIDIIYMPSSKILVDIFASFESLRRTFRRVK